MRHTPRIWAGLLILAVVAGSGVILGRASAQAGPTPPRATAPDAPGAGGHPAQPPQVTPTISPTGTPAPTPCLFEGPWQAEPPMPIARSFAGGAVVNAQFYVIGGVTGVDPSPRIDRYDPTTYGWTQLTLMPTPVSQARVAVIGGKIYVAGGFNVSFGREVAAMQIYDTATDTWSQGAPLPAPRSGAGVAAYNGKIYIIAGNEPVPGPPPSEVPTNTVYLYDPVLDTYTARARLPQIAANIGAATLGDRIYAIGGTLDYAHYAYDPATDTWTPIAAGLTHNFQTPGVFVFNGELWAVGGQDGRNGVNPYPPEQQTQIYSPATNTWRFGPVLLTPRFGSSAVGVLGNRGYVIGGRDRNQNYLSSMESIAYREMFSDVDPTNPFYSYIRCLACRGIMSGYADGTFRWGNAVTRGALSKIVANAAGFADPIAPSRQTFEDVPSSNPFWIYSERLVLHQAISGYACGGAGEPCVPPGNRPYFRWGATAARGQIAKITAVAAGYHDTIPTTRQTFEDIPASNPFWYWIEELSSRASISGYGCGGGGEPCVPPGNRPYFRWAASATRGQMAKIAAQTFYPGCQTPARQ